MERTVTYLFPDGDKASSFKVFQDRTSQIVGYFFTRENIKQIEKYPNACNYAIYFLFDNSELDEKKVYVGQSMNGVSRVKEHVKNKDFWTHCILFVTDNNSFDKLSIDYLEFAFIRKFKESTYIPTNRDLRTNEPNLSIYDKPNIERYVDQIEFLLSTEGVVLKTIKNNITRRYYKAKKSCNAKLYVENGKFVLPKGSELKRPPESTKNWKSDYHYIRYNRLIDEYLQSEKIVEKENVLTLQVDLVFDRPSTAADLVSGFSENGWLFFDGLKNIRNDVQ